MEKAYEAMQEAEKDVPEQTRNNFTHALEQQYLTHRMLNWNPCRTHRFPDGCKDTEQLVSARAQWELSPGPEHTAELTQQAVLFAATWAEHKLPGFAMELYKNYYELYRPGHLPQLGALLFCQCLQETVPAFDTDKNRNPLRKWVGLIEQRTLRDLEILTNTDFMDALREHLERHRQKEWGIPHAMNGEGPGNYRELMRALRGLNEAMGGQIDRYHLTGSSEPDARTVSARIGRSACEFPISLDKMMHLAAERYAEAYTAALPKNQEPGVNRENVRAVAQQVALEYMGLQKAAVLPIPEGLQSLHARVCKDLELQR